ncbi:MAG: beta-Ala-His dipeptidase [Bacteriovoracaceae bacterium]|nr:beta-Ala-His dipeptidase [Bacteriovoracaceae bacterium]
MTKPLSYPKTPQHLWEKFYHVTQTPRVSKKEEKFRQFLIQSAQDRQLRYKTDKAGNVAIYLPATVGYETHEVIIIQSHMDMVCEKLPDKDFDFENDPIEILVKNGWIVANGTTLGADNGFGVAVALALMEAPGLEHPPLELLFTVDEETGLNGALNLDKSMIEGTKIINLDTEMWGDVYIGCAGGEDYTLKGQLTTHKPQEGAAALKIEVSQLTGGHSGMDIHRGRGNAIKILSELLFEMGSLDIAIYSIVGGTAHNVIPRDAQAIINVDPKYVDDVLNVIDSKLMALKAYLPKEDLGIKILCDRVDLQTGNVVSGEQRNHLLNLLSLFPHGAYSYIFNTAGAPLVSTSSNMAICTLSDGELFIKDSMRFFNYNELISLQQKLQSIAYTYGLSIKKVSWYPSWDPEFEGALLDTAKSVYKDMFDEAIKVKAIHAGLECGILKGHLGDIEAISIGPNITSPHSPSEGLEIESANKFWHFLIKLLEML